MLLTNATLAPRHLHNKSFLTFMYRNLSFSTALGVLLSSIPVTEDILEQRLILGLSAPESMSNTDSTLMPPNLHLTYITLQLSLL